MHNLAVMAVSHPKDVYADMLLFGAPYCNDTGVVAQQSNREQARSVCCRAVPPIRVCFRVGLGAL